MSTNKGINLARIIWFLIGIVVVIGVAMNIGNQKSHKKEVTSEWYYNLATIKSVEIETERKNMLNTVVYDYNWYVSYVYDNKLYNGILKEQGVKKEDKSGLQGEYIGIYINPENPQEIEVVSFDIDIIKDF